MAASLAVALRGPYCPLEGGERNNLPSGNGFGLDLEQRYMNRLFALGGGWAVAPTALIAVIFVGQPAVCST